MQLLKKRAVRLVVTVVSIVLAVGLTRSIADLWRRRDIVRERQEELARVEEENKRLKEQLGEVESPEFIERAAREKLGLVKEGETVVIMESEKGKMKNEESREATREAEPNWRRWWRLFF